MQRLQACLAEAALQHIDDALEGQIVVGADDDTQIGNGVADFLALMREVRAGVRASAGVELQPEIVALGREWRELL